MGISYNTNKMFDFTNLHAKPPVFSGGNHKETPLSFEFTSKANQEGSVFGQNNVELSKNTKNVSLPNNSNANANKRPLSFEKKMPVKNYDGNESKNNNSSQTMNKIKKTSISLNSLQNIQPVGKRIGFIYLYIEENQFMTK